LYLFIWKFPIQVMYPFLHWVVDSFGSWVFFELPGCYSLIK
jgi:hypothetical protein